MLHSIEITLYVIISIVLLLKATQRPIWGVAYYMLNFFAQPNYWEWGIALRHPSLRWSWYAAWILLAVTLMNPAKVRFRPNSHASRASLFLVLMVLNAALVNFTSAYDPDASYAVLVEISKFAFLFFLVIATVRSPQDFKLLLAFFTAGLGYWGFEAKFVGVTLIQGRLENFGGPGCAQSNELASITAALLPMMGGLLFMISGVRRLLAVMATALALNILMLCNSRGGFVGLMSGAMVLPILTTGRARKLAINGLAAGALGVFLLAGNPQIISRFVTTFFADTSEEGRLDEANKESRKVFWAAGLELVSDSPFGNGGKCFKSGMGNKYIAKRGLATRDRSCHQGYIEETMSWGVQGLFFRLGFMISAALAALSASRFRARIGDERMSFVGVCVLAGFSAVLITSMFGDFLQMEWGFWLCITAVAYAKIFGESNYGLLPEALFAATENSSSASVSRSSPAPAGVS